MPDCIVISGYAGNSTQADSMRLYMTLAFDAFVEIKRDSVVHGETLPGDLNGGPTVLWVKTGSTLVSSRVARTDGSGDDLSASVPATGGGTMVRHRLALTRETLGNLEALGNLASPGGAVMYGIQSAGCSRWPYRCYQF